jgi:hypothetical protein
MIRKNKSGGLAYCVFFPFFLHLLDHLTGPFILIGQHIFRNMLHPQGQGYLISGTLVKDTHTILFTEHISQLGHVFFVLYQKPALVYEGTIFLHEFASFCYLRARPIFLNIKMLLPDGLTDYPFLRIGISTYPTVSILSYRPVGDKKLLISKNLKNFSKSDKNVLF